MTKFWNAVSTVGALVLAATPSLAIGSVAHAAEGGMQPVHVNVGDLDFASSRDVAVYRQRVDTAAEAFCGQSGASDLGRFSTCRQAVREEVTEKLGSSQRMDLLAQTSARYVWRVSAR